MFLVPRSEITVVVRDFFAVQVALSSDLISRQTIFWSFFYLYPLVRALDSG